MSRSCQGGEGANHVLGREHVGAGIHGIDQPHRPAQQIVPGKRLRAQILAAGIQQENDRGHGDGYAQELTVALEGIHIVQKRIQVDAHDEDVPAPVEDQKELVERDFVVQKAVHHMVALGRVAVFNEKIPHQVRGPEQQPPQMPVLGFVDFIQAEVAQIRLRLWKPHGNASVISGESGFPASPASAAGAGSGADRCGRGGRSDI